MNTLFLIVAAVFVLLTLDARRRFNAKPTEVSPAAGDVDLSLLPPPPQPALPPPPPAAIPSVTAKRRERRSLNERLQPAVWSVPVIAVAAVGLLITIPGTIIPSLDWLAEALFGGFMAPPAEYRKAAYEEASGNLVQSLFLPFVITCSAVTALLVRSVPVRATATAATVGFTIAAIFATL